MGELHRHILVRMTFKAQLPPLFRQQGLILGGMGIVTGVALSLLKGEMLNIATPLEVCCLVAFVTKVASFLPGFEGLPRGRGIVAFSTFNLSHHWMYAGSQEIGLERRVGVMTALARRGLHRIA